jgi:hypothetical protein
MPNGESVQAVTVFAEAVVEGQPGMVAGEATGPSTRSLTVTRYAISGARPTAPFHRNIGLIAGLLGAHGEAPVVAPSVAAGSPRVSVPGYGVLKIFGNWVAGWPAAISARPESGPNENMNVWVPSPSVIYPSPPEICWHLMAPFTVPAVGVTKPPVVPAGEVAGTVNCVGPLYGGSELFAPGCVIVLVGH